MPTAAAAPVAAPVVPPPAPAPVVNPDAALVAEILKQLAKNEGSLQDVTAEAVRLKGVAGLFIATTDGFLVASKIAPDLHDEAIGGIPPNMEGEVLAALFPQLFSKLNEYFKDLEFGQMTNLRFTVGNSTFAVYRTGDLYFAALGRSGEKLPEASLEPIATALTKRFV
jgi:predicted regulator of Ras-like GTPase activity (Roadblock/LC7/MglB family)